jgi:hypothetical protein
MGRGFDPNRLSFVPLFLTRADLHVSQAIPCAYCDSTRSGDAGRWLKSENPGQIPRLKPIGLRYEPFPDRRGIKRRPSWSVQRCGSVCLSCSNLF